MKAAWSEPEIETGNEPKSQPEVQKQSPKINEVELNR